MASSCSSDDSPGNQAPEKTILMAPSDKDTDVEITNLELKWSEATDPNNDPVSYQVYLDTVNPPVTMIKENVTDTSITLSEALRHSTTYYWSIVAKDDSGVPSSSAVATFTTKQTSMEKKIIGKWMLESTTDLGTTKQADECSSQTFLEFKEDQSLNVTFYFGDPCRITSEQIYIYKVSEDNTVFLKETVDTYWSHILTIVSLTNTHMQVHIDEGLVYNLAKQ